MKYYVANHETGDLIEEVNSVEEGNKLIAEYEEEDKKEGAYEPDFYCIMDVTKFVVFEEDNGKKNYDLTIKVCDTLEEAKEIAEYHFNRGKGDIFVADYDAYMDGNYDYLAEYRQKAGD